MIAVVISGAISGLGVFFISRPGVLRGKVQQAREQIRHGMIWLVHRSQVRHRADLAIVGHEASEMVMRKLTSLFVGVVAGVGIDVFFGIARVEISKVLGAMIVVGAGVVGFFLPDSRVRVQASRRRQDFLHAFSSYLDLTNVLLAGGAGTETALIAAADAGDGWSFSEIRDALTRARSARRSPWVELANLGESYNIPELAEVAGSVQLAGEHGARIRLSLSARADSLRNRHMGEIEAQAQAATERMGIPMVLLFIAFIALIGYPAVHLVLGSF
ncbi:MAG: type II secretion system F family protein [Acidimicrobiaceae bacterium]|nr:type II secretion system F family protein [Acidimicrobiaceae bacterium]